MKILKESQTSKNLDSMNYSDLTAKYIHPVIREYLLNKLSEIHPYEVDYIDITLEFDSGPYIWIECHNDRGEISEGIQICCRTDDDPYYSTFLVWYDDDSEEVETLGELSTLINKYVQKQLAEVEVYS
jgi:hypothetical protein